MVFGFFLFVVGYALFYWGFHHMPGQKRYSLWFLLGFGSLFKNVSIPPGPPVQWNATTPNPNQTQPQNPSNNQTPGGVKGVYPVAGSLSMGRTDQGVDWSGSGAVYAIGDGTIINVFNPGWPGGTFIVLKLDNPPAGIPSPDIYYAEDITPAVRVGQHVTAGTVLGTATGGPQGIELGFADPRAIGKALAFGSQFKAWIAGLK